MALSWLTILVNGAARRCSAGGFDPASAKTAGTVASATSTIADCWHHDLALGYEFLMLGHRPATVPCRAGTGNNPRRFASARSPPKAGFSHGGGQFVAARGVDFAAPGPVSATSGALRPHALVSAAGRALTNARSRGVSARTGDSYDLLGVAWQYRWGGGL